MTHQKNLEIAGGLWALPQHAHKVMDAELALSVAQALTTLERETIERCAKVADENAEDEKERCSRDRGHMQSISAGAYEASIEIAQAIRNLKEVKGE